MFSYIPGEDIIATYERFNILLNSLRAFRKIYPNKDFNIKFMRTLPSKWDTKTTTIRESKNHHEMTIQKLHGNLLIYKLELNQRAEITTITKKDKGVILKTVEVSSKAPLEDDSQIDDDDEDLAFLARKLRKFMRKGRSYNNNRNFNNNNNNYNNKRDSSKDLCYNYKSHVIILLTIISL